MKLKTATVSLVFAAFFSFSALAYAAPEVTGYKLNGKAESAKLNPSRGDVVRIEINTNVPVKFRGFIYARLQIANATTTMIAV